jgi:hypothetical protein
LQKTEEEDEEMDVDEEPPKKKRAPAKKSEAKAPAKKRATRKKVNLAPWVLTRSPVDLYRLKVEEEAASDAEDFTAELDHVDEDEEDAQGTPDEEETDGKKRKVCDGILVPPYPVD